MYVYIQNKTGVSLVKRRVLFHYIYLFGVWLINQSSRLLQLCFCKSQLSHSESCLLCLLPSTTWQTYSISRYLFVVGQGSSNLTLSASTWQEDRLLHLEERIQDCKGEVSNSLKGQHCWRTISYGSTTNNRRYSSITSPVNNSNKSAF